MLLVCAAKCEETCRCNSRHSPPRFFLHTVSQRDGGGRRERERQREREREREGEREIEPNLRQREREIRGNSRKCSSDSSSKMWVCGRASEGGGGAGRRAERERERERERESSVRICACMHACVRAFVYTVHLWQCHTKGRRYACIRHTYVHPSKYYGVCVHNTVDTPIYVHCMWYRYIRYTLSRASPPAFKPVWTYEHMRAHICENNCIQTCVGQKNICEHNQRILVMSRL